jgi:hypothetical protein
MDDRYTSRLGIQFGGTVSAESKFSREWAQATEDGLNAFANGDEDVGYHRLVDAADKFDRLMRGGGADRNTIFALICKFANHVRNPAKFEAYRRAEILEQLGHFLIRLEYAPVAEQFFDESFRLRRHSGDELLTLRLGLFNAYIHQSKFDLAEKIWIEVSPRLAARPPGDGRAWFSAAYTTMLRRSRYDGNVNLENLKSVMQSTFISYGQPDIDFARKLHLELERRGAITFFFPEHAEPGERLHRVMRKGVNEFDRIILICSRCSLDRLGVLNEIEEALSREARDGGTPYIIPITIDDYIYSAWNPPRLDLAQAIRDRVVADFRMAVTDESEFKKAIGKLVNTLERKI